MDDDLLHTNQYIPNSNANAGYGMTAELRKFNLRAHAGTTEIMLPDAPPLADVFSDDMLISNPVLGGSETDGLLGIEAGTPGANRSGVIYKEKRTILAIDSKQRNITGSVNIADVAVGTFEAYVLPADWANFQTFFAALVASSASGTAISYQGGTQTVNPDAVNNSLQGLLHVYAMSTSMGASIGKRINSLNGYLMASPTHSRTGYWRPFYYDSTHNQVRVIVHNEQKPSQYMIDLHDPVLNVKSIRLISSEIPNTVNNITERNNIITLSIRTSADKVPLALDSTVSTFRFVMIKLDVGCYELSDLITHIQTKLNAEARTHYTPISTDIFDVTLDAGSGKIEITCSESTYEFHLKFYSRLEDINQLTSSVIIGGPANQVTLTKTIGNVTEHANDLWHMLGFPWPFEVDSDSTDKYTLTMNNVVRFDPHTELASGHADNDIFDRTNYIFETNIHDDKTYLDDVTKYEAVYNMKPYRYPCIETMYIYLVLKDFNNFHHITQGTGGANGTSGTNGTTFTHDDIFAKVLLNVTTGLVAYDSFVANPLIFPTALSKLERLDIRWISATGATVDFGGVDHSFTLEVIHYISQLESNHYSSTSGMTDKKSYPDYLVGI